MAARPTVKPRVAKRARKPVAVPQARLPAAGMRPGRPRSAEAQKAILDATLDLLAETGIVNLTVEGVAARAGVGKATIYRRWSSKLPLVVDAISTLPELRVPNTGTLPGDLRQIVGSLARILNSSPLGRVLAHLVAETGSDPEVDAAVSRYVRVRRQPLVEVVQRGLDRGELPAGADPDVLTDLVVGPLINRLLFSRGAVDGAFIERVIATVIGGTEKIGVPSRPTRRRATAIRRGD